MSLTKERLSDLITEYKKGDDPVVRTFRIVNFSAGELELDINVDFFGLKEFLCHIVRVSEDLICATYDGNEEYIEIQNGLEKTIRTFMDSLVQKRDDYLLNEVGTPTPGTGKGNSQKIFDIDDGDEMVDDFEEGEMQDQLTCHVNDCKTYYESKYVSLIGQIYNVRLTVIVDDMSPELKKEYGINSQNNWFTMSINFAPDYLTHDSPPRVQYKPELAHLRSGFAEQMEHVLTKFIDMRWEQLKFDKTTKFGAADLKLSTWSSKTTPKEKKEIITKFIKEKKISTAKALALYYTNISPEAAEELLRECGYYQQNLYTHDKALVSGHEPKTNFILEMLTYLTLRVQTCNHFCCGCDDDIQCHDLLPNVHENRPVICTKFKCQFEYIELGVCNTIPIVICPSSIHTDILENGDVVDIMVSMAYSAATSGRKELIFDPFPEYLSKGSNKNFDLVIKSLDKIPSIAEMRKHCDNEYELKKFLHADAYEILRWLLSCKRCALVKMPEKKRIKEMQTQYQYIMMMDNPEKAASFSQNRKKYGSYWAFHGSAIENFHSILRNGLVNASNTKLMTTGAAYGPGVYMARESATSFGYSRIGTSWPKSQFGNVSALRCVMICEVNKAPGVPTTANPYYVVPQAEHITTRFFCFYPSSETSVNVVADSITCLKDFVQ